jgi:hypothetical protein
MRDPEFQVVETVMVTRACGCSQEFQHYAADRYQAQRLKKFQSTRCAECVKKADEEQRKAAAALPSKGEAMQALPAGTTFTMTRQADGSWLGVVTIEDVELEATGDSPQALAILLARHWLTSRRE